jgi:hypothetical protein
VRTTPRGQKDTTGIWYGADIIRIAHYALVIEDQPIGVWRDPEHRHDVPQWFCIQKLTQVVSENGRY